MAPSPDQISAAAAGRTVRSAAVLSRAIAAGDAGALAEFYEGHFDGLYARARAFTGRDEAFCLDVVQEAVVRIARRMRPMATDGDVERWAGAVLRSAARDLLRRDRRRAQREGRAGAARPEVIRAEEAAPAEAVRAAVAALDPEEAILLKLRFGAGATLEQAGAAVGASGAAAHGRIRRALGKLKRSLTESRP